MNDLIWEIEHLQNARRDALELFNELSDKVEALLEGRDICPVCEAKRSEDGELYHWGWCPLARANDYIAEYG